jgi:two-component system, NarL family, nitrate/nitrite response regulator NarL
LTVIRVFILTDIRLYREGLAALVDRQAGMQVVGTAAAQHATVAALRERSPDVVLLDMAMLDSVATLQSLIAALPDAKVIALAVPDTDGHVVACAEGGVAGYVPRDGDISALLSAIDSAGRGELLCTPQLAGALARRVATLANERADGQAGPAAELTGREREIPALIDDGRSNKEIARELCIEVATVKNHVHNILGKLQVHRRSEAAARIRRHRDVATRM